MFRGRGGIGQTACTLAGGGLLAPGALALAVEALPRQGQPVVEDLEVTKFVGTQKRGGGRCLAEHGCAGEVVFNAVSQLEHIGADDQIPARECAQVAQQPAQVDARLVAFGVGPQAGGSHLAGKRAVEGQHGEQGGGFARKVAPGLIAGVNNLRLAEEAQFHGSASVRVKACSAGRGREQPHAQHHGGADGSRCSRLVLHAGKRTLS